MSNEKSMPFLEHLGELRKHILRALVGVLVASVLIGVFWNWIKEYMFLQPLQSNFITYKLFNKMLNLLGLEASFTADFSIAQDLQNVTPMGQLTAQLIAVVTLGIILAMPYIVFEIWRFVKPALKDNERKNFYFFFFSSTIFFMLGVLFSYFVILPLSIQFFFFYTPFDVPNQWHLSKYIKLFAQTLLGFGLIFLFPIINYFLATMGLITHDFLKKYRKQAFVVILVLSAIITPSDPLTMLIAAFPLLILFEFSILVVKMVQKKEIQK